MSEMREGVDPQPAEVKREQEKGINRQGRKENAKYYLTISAVKKIN